MARDTGPQCKQCRREGLKLFLKGERCLTDKCSVERRPYPPGQHGRGRKRFTEYQMRLVEKQKLRAIYGVGERQFRGYFERAERKTGVTGEELLRQLETRADSVVLRLGFALTMRQARQLVTHGHIEIDGRRIDVPSMQVRAGQTIGVREKSRGLIPVREALELTPDPPPYLYRNKDEMQGTLSRDPERQEIPLPVDVEERLIVEFYS
jgi:small subunit ribosomal protein S4